MEEITPSNSVLIDISPKVRLSCKTNNNRHDENGSTILNQAKTENTPWWSIFIVILIARNISSNKWLLYNPLNCCRFNLKDIMLFIILLFITSLIGYPIYCLVLIIEKGDIKGPIFKIYLNIYFMLRCILPFTATFALAVRPGFNKILGPIYTNYLIIKTSSKSKIYYFEYKVVSKSIILNFFLSWPFTVIATFLYTFGFPAIHPDYRPQGTEWAFPLLYPIFCMNLLNLFYIQLFWMNCYRLENKCKIQNLGYKQDEQNSIEQESNQCEAKYLLESMRSMCKNALSIAMKYDESFGWFTSFSIILAFFGLIIPVNEFRHLWKNHELDTDRHNAIMIWIIASFFMLLHTLFRAINIPLTYQKNIKLYTININPEDLSKEFNDEYDFVDKKIFSQSSPNLTFSGIAPINISFLTVALIIQFLNLIWQWSDLVPIHSSNNGTLTGQYESITNDKFLK